MSLLKLVGVLLDYPRDELWEHGDELLAAAQAAELPTARRAALAGFVGELLGTDALEAQDAWLSLFDRGRSMSLLLFEHIHGESRDRGQAMVDLMEEYKTHGFEMVSEELPDYVPLFLEFLSQCEPEVATPLLGDAVHVLNHVAVKLAESNSPYAGVLQAAVSLSPVTPEPLVTPPVRDMDEAMETFGPGVDGIEPLLKPTSAVAPINFYRQTPQPA